MNGVRMPRRPWLKRMFSLGAASVSAAMVSMNSQQRSTQAEGEPLPQLRA
jgi:hypothetical protein